MKIKDFENQYSEDLLADQVHEDSDLDLGQEEFQAEDLEDVDNDDDNIEDFNSALKEDQNGFFIPNEDLLNRTILEFVNYLAKIKVISQSQSKAMMSTMKKVETTLKNSLLGSEFQPSIVVRNSDGNQVLGVDSDVEDNDSIVFQWSGGTFGNIQENILASFLKRNLKNVTPWPGPVANFSLNEGVENSFSDKQNKNKFPDININGINMDFKACYCPGSRPSYNNACGDQYEVANAVLDFLENKNSQNFFGGSINIFTYYQTYGNIARIVGFKCVPSLMCLQIGQNGFSVKWGSNDTSGTHNGNVRIYLSTGRILKNFNSEEYVKKLINAAKTTLGKESADAEEELQNDVVSL